ncbi:MAG: LacI family DNA-binding transcriptional regulator [Kiritimatiellae bacterium]|nr:LacI family DNA-binding transcriptional regulator [Kiritimatiellia bacterium]
MNEQSKYRQIFEALRKSIRDGVYTGAVPLPSEEALVRKYKVSRITAVRAMEELVRCGLVYRKRGAGTFATKTARLESGRLGLIMPSLAVGEVFPVMCQALMRCARKDGYSLVLGDISASTPSKRAIEAGKVARAFVEQHVAGVVLQPLAFLRTPERVTREILTLFDNAEIPVVLIDRSVRSGREPVRHDFVGIDNVAAGRALGEHMMNQGAKRVRFLMRPNCAAVIQDRLEGAASALGLGSGKDFKIVACPDDLGALGPIFRKRNRPDAVICESDYVAAVFRNTLDKLGLSVPGDVLLAGFDDVRCAKTTFPQLTTIHQPCGDIALIAYLTLRERIRNPGLPPRHICLPAPLVIRESTGAVRLEDVKTARRSKRGS